MFQKIWSCDSIIEHIRSRSEGEPLNSHYYAGKYPDVYAAAERFFGSWGAALESCGYSYQDIRKYRSWTKERVITEIRKLESEGVQLSSKFIQTNYRPLYLASVRRFGSWGAAVRRAGFEYNRIRQRRLLTPEDIIKEIRRVYKSGESLAYTNMRENYQYLLAAGMRKLGNGSWVKAREVCGIQVNCRAKAAKLRAATRKEQQKLAEKAAKAAAKVAARAARAAARAAKAEAKAAKSEAVAKMKATAVKTTTVAAKRTRSVAGKKKNLSK